MQKFKPRSKSTNVSSPQTALHISSRETTSPARATRQARACAGWAGKRTSAPSRRSSRAAASNSKRPNRKCPVVICVAAIVAFFRVGVSRKRVGNLIAAHTCPDAHRHFHAARSQRRRPQQNQNGRASRALRIPEIHRLSDFHPKRQRHFQNEGAQPRQTNQPDSNRHRTQLRLSSRCDSSHI